jgi:hypothetical protein
MTLSKEFFERDTNISAKVIADSVTPEGNRITTFELEYHRYIHGEVMTNRAFSRNCSSSRAIPIHKMLGYTEDNMAIPIYWGSKKAGMQAGNELPKTWLPEFLWRSLFKVTKTVVKTMDKLRLHKQIPNRLIEPWQMIKVVVTATEYDNFFNLRIEGAAQPEIAMLAHKMYHAMELSAPTELVSGEYHLPYVRCIRDMGIMEYFDQDYNPLTLEEAIKMSAASCAAQSYRTDTMTIEKAEKIYKMLITDKTLHASPFENIATPLKSAVPYEMNDINFPETCEKGLTHVRKDGTICSGNFVGWSQYRQTMDNNTCYDFEYEKRMEEFELEGSV